MEKIKTNNNIFSLYTFTPLFICTFTVLYNYRCNALYVYTFTVLYTYRCSALYIYTFTELATSSHWKFVTF